MAHVYYPSRAVFLQAAISANATIWPVAIRYLNTDGSINREMAYTGSMTLGESMMNVLKQKNPTVELRFLLPITTLGGNRQAAAAAVFTAISNALNL